MFPVLAVQWKWKKKRLRRLEAKLDTLLERTQTMSDELDVLTAEVAETKAVVDSAIIFIQGLAAQILALKDDPKAIAALAADLDEKTNELAAAIATPPA